MCEYSCLAIGRTLFGANDNRNAPEFCSIYLSVSGLETKSMILDLLSDLCCT